MRFRRLNKEVELPEKSGNSYINVRSSQRIDVRPGEVVEVPTGVEVSVSKTEHGTLVGQGVLETLLAPGGYRELIVPVYNPLERNLMIYPGQAIASINVIKTEKVTKRTTVSSTARVVTDKEELEELKSSLASLPDEPGWQPKEPCGGCP